MIIKGHNEIFAHITKGWKSRMSTIGNGTFGRITGIWLKPMINFMKVKW